MLNKISILMKKLLLFILFISFVNCFPQAVTVDTNTYTVPQLVNNVLINSPCINATNISWSTGTNFGSTNGIGYFQNTNPNFPMQSGVILSTGNVHKAPGPNTTLQSAGNAAWTGDASLEATLASSGITMTSANATVLQFDFVPLSSHFDFNFLFASEEYGNFQCQYSDAFAFLLTNLNTGVTTNLAVVPGTNNPISVVTIRDFLYNSNCPSVNQQFFGSYNGGSNANSAAINFNGQTKVLNASANLTPNVPYKIKLVIADRGDYQSDSAIFLSSNSFNIGQQVLGSDLLVANNTAICSGQTSVLNSGLDPATYTFVWKKDGVVISGQTGPTLTVSQAGNYELTYTNIAFSCQTITDSVIVEYFSNFTTANPHDLHKCNTGQASYTFDLSVNSNYINAGINPPYSISYFTSLIDANNNVNEIPTTYSSAGNQTLYVRINNPNTSCYLVKSFQLSLVTSPVANQPSTYTVCANDVVSGIATFNLSSLNSQVLGGQNIGIYNVTYYPTMADANAGTNPLPNSFNSAGTTIYPKVRLIDDAGCYSVTSVALFVSPLPLVDNLDDVITCTDYILQPLNNGNYFTGSNGSGTPLFAGDVISVTQTIYIFNTTNTTPSCPNESNFKVVIIKPSEFSLSSGVYCNSYALPFMQFGEYRTAPNGGGTIIPNGTVLTTSQTVYYYFKSLVPPFCVIDLSFDIQIVQSQTVITYSNQFDCTTFVLQPLSFGNYFDGPNGTGNQIPAGSNINSSSTIYIHGTVGTCVSDSQFQVVIGLNFPTDVTECVQYTLPQLVVGNYFTGPMGTGTQIPEGTNITSSQTIYVYAVSQSQPNCTDNYHFQVTIKLPFLTPPAVTTGCENYTLPSLNAGNYYTQPGGTGTMLLPNDVLTTSQTVYIYINDNNGCTNDLPFQVTINQRPIIDSRSLIDTCDQYTLTNLMNGNYFTGPNGTGTMLSGGTVLSSSQLVYIYAMQNGCSAETSFQLNIFSISAQQSPNISKCDSYILPALTGNNKYYSQADGPYGNGVEIPAGTSITTTQTVYIYVESGGRINCSNQTSFVITIIPSPVIAPIAPVYSCESYTLPQLTVGNYYTQPNKGGTQLNSGTVITTNQVVYVYAETGTIPNCYDEKSFSITLYNVDQLSNVTTCDNYILPVLSVGNYYNGPNGTGGLLPSGSLISNSKTVYIFGNSGYNPNCTDETSFVVTIIPKPFANTVPVALTTLCDVDGINDGITNFYLVQLTSTILGTQTGSEFSVTYFENFNDANSNINSVTSTTASTVFARVSNSLAPNCYDIKSISIIVNKLPEPTVKNGIICVDSKTGSILNPYLITSGLPLSSNTFQWFNAQGQLVGTSNNYLAILAGTYSLIVKNNLTECSSTEVFVTVSPSEPAIVAYSINEDFSGDQSVTIEATGTGGDYEYQLDNLPFQDSPVFNNVVSGMHTITVRDKNGCGTTNTDAIVINYPHYFTPNGDGINDTWNIVDLANQEVSNIYIFDRYGKVLKNIKPSGQGWDGSYNNQLMISDDYWFTITYIKNGESKEFKAHFALKR